MFFFAWGQISRTDRRDNLHDSADGDVALEKGTGLLHIVLTAPSAFVDMRIADALV